MTRRTTALMSTALALVIGLLSPLSASAATSGPSASIRVNGSRSSTVAYGSNPVVSWNATGFETCTVAPKNWTGLQGNRTEYNVTAKQTYKLSCSSPSGTATAYATYAVATPTFAHVQKLLSEIAADPAGKKADLQGMKQKITEAESYFKSGKAAKAEKLLDHTVARIHKFVEKDKVSSIKAAAFVAAVQTLTASWTSPEVVPDAIPDDELIMSKPANGGYPSKWADIPISSVVDSWGMYNRQPVSYTAFKVHQDFLAGNNTRDMPYWGGRGNSNQWDDNARAAGIPVDTTPVPGSIAISNAGYYGHAMYVERVEILNGQPAVYVSQYNAAFDGAYSEGWRSTTGLVFIHF